ncbi:MAG: carbohydrate binding domain-containing protein, partial [Spirochaetales bacterium]|nr:carbohydrate binding domain-containing protein [Spirochaetales bacterium]
LPVLLDCGLPGSSGKKPGETNLLENGDFSDGTTGWFVWGNDGGAAVMSVENGELRIDISDPGPHQWSIGLGQTGFEIESGIAYSLSFQARASCARIMTSVVQLGHDPWTAYSPVNSTDLTTTAADYDYTFFMVCPTDDNTDLEFFIGGQGAGTIYIDDIVLKKLTKEEKEKDYPVVAPDANYSNLILYEIHPGTYNGTWGDGECLNWITARLDRIKQLGVNCLWINPVLEGVGGGYWTYDYYRISYRLGTLNDIKRLVYEAHKRDMLVIIDLVINHVWIEHLFFQDVVAKGSASDYADWFFWDGEPGASDFEKPFAHETELANINFNNADAKEYMFAMAEYWLNKLDIDGYRVDVAMLLEDRHPGLAAELITRLETVKPAVFMLAEGYASDDRFFNDGYDSAYDWDIRGWDWSVTTANSLNKAFAGTTTLQDMHGYLTRPLAAGGLPLRFAENHDMTRAVTEWGIGGSKVAHTVIMMSRGYAMFFGGGEVGFTPNDPSVPWSQLDPVVWDYSCPLYEYFPKIGGIRKQYLKSDLLQYWIDNDNTAVYSSLSVSGTNRLLTVANFNGAVQTVTLSLTIPELGTIANLTDLITDTAVPYDGGGSLTLTLEGYGTAVLLIQ